MALLPVEQTLSKEALAEYLGVLAAYLAEQMQALSRAGLVVAQRGANGGYTLARDAKDISLWDVTAAVEGTAPSFRCTEVRQNGPCGSQADECHSPCEIASVFYRAEQAYRDTLASTSLAELVDQASSKTTKSRKQDIAKWLAQTSQKNISVKVG